MSESLVYRSFKYAIVAFRKRAWLAGHIRRNTQSTDACQGNYPDDIRDHEKKLG